MNKIKDPVVTVNFGGEKRPIRWDYNTIAELQDLGFDLTDEAFLASLKGSDGNPKRPTLKMLRAMATAALISGAEDGRTFTPAEVGRIVSSEGGKSEIFNAVTELMRLTHGDEPTDPPAAAPSNA